MRKLTVLVDMDDCIEGLSLAWGQYLNARHGTNVPYEAINQWDVAAAFPMLTREQVYAPLYEDEFWSWVKPIEGAADTLRRLKSDGHEVLIVTASNYETIKTKMDDVLFRYFPFIEWDDVIVTSKKHHVAGDVLVDDGPHNFREWSYRKILMSAMHNMDFDEREVGAVRVNNWEEAYREICKIADN